MNEQSRNKPKRANAPAEVRKRAFLEAFGRVGNVTAAARMVGIDRQEHYRWMNDDDGYRERFQMAMGEAVDRLVSVARKRALKGSDTLMVFLLKNLGMNEYEGAAETPYKVYVNIDPEKV